MELDALNAIYEQNEQIIDLLKGIKEGGLNLEIKREEQQRNPHQTEVRKRPGRKPSEK